MSKRHQRLTGLFLEEITLALRNVHGLNDKGILTITGAELSGDDKTLDVFFSVLGAPEERDRKERILAANSREIRTILFKKLRLKAVPQIFFKFDETPQKAAHIEQLMDQIRSETNETDENT
ncbi:MAG: hypothetical protein COT18_08565 [Elusimicrobia bacterium CG08_land_8_20_14_0_20_59_10]|nr:MAG: hypothetical protein COT18_08565 [Elusimicrobia bacterium CG08_land_8_20_14_0_20_59_10]